MRNQILAKRYASALLTLGKEDGLMDQYGRELADLSAAVAGLGPEGHALTSPIFPEAVRRRMLEAILEKAALSPMVGNFIRLLEDKGRLAELVDIAEIYQKLVDAENGLIHGYLTSAGKLEQAEVEAIAASLGKFAERKVVLSVTEDPEIIGGLVAKLGDLTIDGSIRTQLRKLSENLLRGGGGA